MICVTENKLRFTLNPKWNVVVAASCCVEIDVPIYRKILDENSFMYFNVIYMNYALLWVDLSHKIPLKYTKVVAMWQNVNMFKVWILLQGAYICVQTIIKLQHTFLCLALWWLRVVWCVLVCLSFISWNYSFFLFQIVGLVHDQFDYIISFNFWNYWMTDSVFVRFPKSLRKESSVL